MTRARHGDPHYRQRSHARWLVQAVENAAGVYPHQFSGPKLDQMLARALSVARKLEETIRSDAFDGDWKTNALTAEELGHVNEVILNGQPQSDSSFSSSGEEEEPEEEDDSPCVQAPSPFVF